MIVSKAIFILALSLASLIGTTNVQSDIVEQNSTSCTTIDELIMTSPVGGGFTDWVITRSSGLVISSNQNCGILGVQMVNWSNGSVVHFESFATPQRQAIIPSAISRIPGNYLVMVQGDSGCYDFHLITIN